MLKLLIDGIEMVNSFMNIIRSIQWNKEKKRQIHFTYIDPTAYHQSVILVSTFYPFLLGKKAVCNGYYSKLLVVFIFIIFLFCYKHFYCCVNIKNLQCTQPELLHLIYCVRYRLSFDWIEGLNCLLAINILTS